MGGKTSTISTSEPRIGALRIQQSTYGLPLFVVWGANRVPGNLIDYNNFRTIAVTTTTTSGGKGGGGKTKQQDTKYQYYAAPIMAVSEGPVASIQTVWRGKTKITGAALTGVKTTTEIAVVPASGVVRPSMYAYWSSNTSVARCANGSETADLALTSGSDYTVSAGVYTFDTSLAGRTVRIVYQWTPPAWMTSADTAAGFTLFRGDVGQAPWSYMTTSYPAKALAYSHTAYLAAQSYRLTDSAEVENHTFEVNGRLQYPGLRDANPADIAADALTNPQFGASFPGDRLGDLTTYSTFCRASGLFLSPALTEQTEAGEFLSQLAKMTNSALVWSGGKLKIVPYGDAPLSGNGAAYSPNLTPAYDLTDDDFQRDGDADPVKCNRKTPADAFNQVQVEFLNRANDYNVEIAEAKDQANIEQFGLRTAEPVEMHWITDAQVATYVANLILQRGLYVRNEYQFRLGWKYALLEPMDLVTITDAKLDVAKIPVRLTSIDENEWGDLTITAEDFPAGVASAALYPPTSTAGYFPDFSIAPGNIVTPAFFEPPASLTNGDLQVWCAVSGSGANWGGCSVWVSTDGTNYKRSGAINGGSRYGSLTASLAAGPSTGPAAVLLDGQGGQMLSGSADDARSLTTLCWIGGELVAHTAATLTGTNAYSLTLGTRGAYQTPTAAKASGTRFIRLDDAIGKSESLPLSMLGRPLYFKFTSFNVYGGGEESLDAVPAYVHTLGDNLGTATYTLQDSLTGVLPPVSSGINFVPNAEFEFNTANAPVHASGFPLPAIVGAAVCDGWQIAKADKGVASVDLFGASVTTELKDIGSRSLLISVLGGKAVPSDNVEKSCEIASSPVYVKASEHYTIRCDACTNNDATPPAGVSLSRSMVVAYYDFNGTELSRTPITGVIPQTTFAEMKVGDQTIPTGTSFLRVICRIGITNNSGSTYTTPSSSYIHRAYFDDFSGVGDVVSDKLGGNGINLLPDQYSTFEQSTLPPMQYSPPAGSLSRDTSSKVVVAGLRFTNTATDNYALLSPAWTNFNIPCAQGRKYIVSFWVKASAVGLPLQVWLFTASGNGRANLTTPAGSTADFVRVSALIDMSAVAGTAMSARIDNDGGAGTWIVVDGIMVEEAIGNLNKPSTYTRGRADGIAYSALLSAIDAKATADGSMDIFRQPTPPTGAKYGDYWQDSDDGRWYFWNGAWVDSTDNRIPQAISDAAAANAAASTAQTTANSKIRLWYQEAQPTATTNGDQWYQPSTKLTRYWNGSGWSLLSDQTAAIADLLVANGDFEAKDANWSFENNWYVETSTNAALTGTGLVRQGNGSAPNSRASNNIRFKITPGARVRVQSYIRNLGNGANGAAMANVVWVDKDSNYLGEDGPSYASGSVVAGATEWRSCVKTITAPANAVYGYMSALVTSHTSGYWCYDNMRASMSVDNLDEVPNGSTYARTQSSRLQNGVPFGASGGVNIIQNPSFELNYIGKPTNNHYSTGTDIIDGWRVLDSTAGAPLVEDSTGVAARTGRNKMTLRVNANLTIPASAFADSSVYTPDKIPVRPGDRYLVQGYIGLYADKSIPAGLTTRIAIALVYSDANDGYVGETAININNNVGANGMTGAVHSASGTVPVGATHARLWLILRTTNTTGSAITTPSTGTICLPYFDDVFVAKISNLDFDIDHGTTYGKTANMDLFDDPGTGLKRVGSSVIGSKKQLGGPRNMPINQVMGYAAVNSTTPLSATSAGAVSINAFTVNLNGETVSYSAVSNAITGLTAGSTYVIYCIDLYADGGTRTWYAAATVLAAQQASMGCVVAGVITIPTSGSSSGGSTGNTGGGSYCLEWEMVLPDGTFARDHQPGDMILCVDPLTGAAYYYPLLSIDFGEEECYRLFTPTGAAVQQSKSTPMVLPDGRKVMTPEMFGKPIWANVDGVVSLTIVSDLEYLGMRRVVKYNLGDRMFFAGEVAERTLGTHNLKADKGL